MTTARWSLMLFLAAILSLNNAASAQALYKSVDASGKVVYSDKPPVSGTTEKTLKLENLPVSVVPGAAPLATPGRASTGTVAAAPPSGDVVLYMATWCGYCKAAKAYLGNKGIAYRELDIDTPAGKAAFAQIGGRGVPVLLTNGQRISGFTTQSYDAVFVARK
jgi:glutaredoxin